MHFYVVTPLSALVPINIQLYADARCNISEIHFVHQLVKWCYRSALWVNALSVALFNISSGFYTLTFTRLHLQAVTLLFGKYNAWGKS